MHSPRSCSKHQKAGDSKLRAPDYLQFALKNLYCVLTRMLSGTRKLEQLKSKVKGHNHGNYECECTCCETKLSGLFENEEMSWDEDAHRCNKQYRV